MFGKVCQHCLTAVVYIYIEGARRKIFLVVYYEGGKRTKKEQKGVERIYALSIETPF